MEARTTALSRAVSHLFLRLRQRSGMDQKELALHAGVSLATVRIAERNAGRLAIDLLPRLAESLGIDHILLIHEAERRTPPHPGISRPTEEQFLDLLCGGDRFARFKAEDQLQLLRAIDAVPPASLKPRATASPPRSRSPRRVRRPSRARTR